MLRDAGNGFLSFLLIVRNSVMSVARKGEICISSFPRRRESSVAEYVYMKKMRPHMGSHFRNRLFLVRLDFGPFGVIADVAD